MSQTPTHYFDSSGGKLLVAGVPIRAFVAKYGTPMFVYDQEVLERKWRLLRSALPSRFAIHYSIKANPNQRILKFFLNRGAGLEVASCGELYQALFAGCSASDIVFAGPGKTDAELEQALNLGIREIHVESFGELQRIEEIAGRLGAIAPIGVRVNPSAEIHGAAMHMGGRPSPFGIDEEQLEAFVRCSITSPRLKLRGLHVYIGTQILDAGFMAAQYHNAVRIAQQLTNWTREPLATLDFGGGLGVPYFSHEHELDVQSFARGVAEVSQVLDDDPLLAKTQCIVEPGRFLVAESGIYVSRITDIKTSRGKIFVVLDGGMHHHLAASGNLGQTIKRNYPVAILNKIDAPETETVDLVGPLCTPLDVLGRSVTLPPAEVGDLIGVFQSGAYARASSPLGFLSHSTPPEVWASDGKHDLIRRRGSFRDYLADQPFESRLLDSAFGLPCESSPYLDSTPTAHQSRDT